MKKLQLACLATLLASGIVQASPICNGLEIKLRNNLADDLLIQKVKLDGAEITPNEQMVLHANSIQTFTVAKSLDDTPMTGEFVLFPQGSPDKKVTIKYTLKNSAFACQHTDISPTDNAFIADDGRHHGYVEYTIKNKS